LHIITNITMSDNGTSMCEFISLIKRLPILQSKWS
jgi:hypothetical protein